MGITEGDWYITFWNGKPDGIATMPDPENEEEMLVERRVATSDDLRIMALAPKLLKTCEAILFNLVSIDEFQFETEVSMLRSVISEIKNNE